MMSIFLVVIYMVRQKNLKSNNGSFLNFKKGGPLASIMNKMNAIAMKLTYA